jgi:outer membrane protein
MKQTIFAILASALIGLFAARPADAGSYQDWENWLSSGNSVLRYGVGSGPFRTNIGLGTAFAPDYYGSRDFEFKPLPLLDTTYKGTVFVSTQQGIGYNLWRKRTVRAGPRVTLDMGRDSKDDPRFATLPDVDPSVELGLFVEAYSGSWRFRGDVRKDISDGHDGLLINLDAGYGMRWGKDTSLVFGARTVYMDTSYAESYFGVSTSQATSILPYYKAESGFRDVQGYVQAVYDITKRLYISLEGRGTFMTGSAADSPITETSNFFTGSVLAGYRF